MGKKLCSSLALMLIGLPMTTLAIDTGVSKPPPAVKKLTCGGSAQRTNEISITWLPPEYGKDHKLGDYFFLVAVSGPRKFGAKSNIKIQEGQVPFYSIGYADALPVGKYYFNVVTVNKDGAKSTPAKIVCTVEAQDHARIVSDGKCLTKGKFLPPRSVGISESGQRFSYQDGSCCEGLVQMQNHATGAILCWNNGCIPDGYYPSNQVGSFRSQCCTGGLVCPAEFFQNTAWVCSMTGPGATPVHPWCSNRVPPGHLITAQKPVSPNACTLKLEKVGNSGNTYICH